MELEVEGRTEAVKFWAVWGFVEAATAGTQSTEGAAVRAPEPVPGADDLPEASASSAVTEEEDCWFYCGLDGVLYEV